MPFEIPCTPDGARQFVIDAGPEYLTLRTYLSVGVEPVWMLDISTADNAPLLAGVPLVPGSDNILKGMGGRLQGYCITVALLQGGQGDPEALGSSLRLVFFGPDDAAWPAIVREE